MANTVTLPDVRYGSSFLDKKYKKYAENGEVIIDKITGELLFKRKADGKLVSFTQNDKYIHDIAIELRILMQNNLDFVYPDSDESFFLSTDYNVQDILNNTIDPINLTQTYSMDFPIDNSEEAYRIGFHNSIDSNGFCIRLIPRDTDKTFIEYMTSFYNTTFKNYDGEDTKYIGERVHLASDRTWVSSNSTVYYTVRVHGYNASVSDEPFYTDVSSSINVYIDHETVVKFPPSYAYNFDRIIDVEVFITSISFHKLEMAELYMIENGVDRELYNKLLPPDKIITIEHVNIFNFIDSSSHIPTQNTVSIIACMNSPSMIIESSTIDKLNGGTGIIISDTEPTTKWGYGDLWGEVITTSDTPGIINETDHPTDLSELESWVFTQSYKPTIITTDATDIESFLFEVVNTDPIPIEEQVLGNTRNLEILNGDENTPGSVAYSVKNFKDASMRSINKKSTVVNSHENLADTDLNINTK